MLLTIDIGTSTFKSALYDYDGNRLSFASCFLSKNTECAQWLRAFEKCCRELGNLSKVEAIVISGNGPTLVPVLGEPSVAESKLFAPAQNARLWLERSAVKYQEEVTKVMGGFVDAGFFLPKILSIKNEEEKLYGKVKHFLGCPEYLAYALTGEARTVFPSDGFDRWFWNDDVLKKLELDAAKFPPFIRPGDPFGQISAQAASAFGFAKSIPVISGGPDFFAAILGAGVTKPAEACDRTGSSEGINLCTQNRITDKRLMSYSHPIAPYWNLSGIINTTGTAIEWGTFFLGLKKHEEFFAIAQKSKCGSGGVVFLPYLAGERAPIWKSDIRGSWHGINLNTNKSDFTNSILESIGFAIKDVITVMEENGQIVNELRVTGGLADNGYLNQIKADITSKEILAVQCKEAELLGCAIIGSCSLGRYASFAQACEKMVKIEKRYEPDQRNAELYVGLFQKYREYQKSVLHS